jgi:high affinity sulfate transporter 1
LAVIAIVIAIGLVYNQTVTMQFLAIASWLPNYQRKYLRGDVVAGIALVGLLIPEAMGYAGIAGLPPESGLYATGIGLLVYALFGSSSQLAVSPTSSSAAILAATVAILASGDRDIYVVLAASVAILVGVIFLLAGLLRLGFVSEFVSKPVLKGFVFGIALTIIIKQLPKLLGFERGAGNTLQQAWYVMRSAGSSDPWTAAVGLVALASLFALHKYLPRMPGALIVLVAGIVGARMLGLHEHGVHLVGEIPAGLSRFKLPRIGWTQTVELIPASVGLALVLYAEALGAARTFAIKNNYDIDANTELYALGLANVFSGLYGGMVVGGGTSGTAMNDSSGARSQVSTMVGSGMVVITLLVLTGFFRDLPEAVLAAIVIHAVWHLIDIAELRRYAHIRPLELTLPILAIVGVLLFGILDGLVLAVVATLVVLMRALMRPHLTELGRLPGTDYFVELSRHPEADRIPGLLMVRLDGFLIFATANYARQELDGMISHAGRPLKAVLFNMEVIPNLDMTAIDTLADMNRKLSNANLELLLAKVKDPVRNALERSGLARQLDGRIFRRVPEAVEAFNGTTVPSGAAR